MLTLHPQVIKKDGLEEFVVLPWREFQQLAELLEDAIDLQELRRAKLADDGSPGIPLEEVMKRFGVKPDESE
jgi:hypothetical protein